MSITEYIACQSITVTDDYTANAYLFQNFTGLPLGPLTGVSLGSFMNSGEQAAVGESVFNSSVQIVPDITDLGSIDFSNLIGVYNLDSGHYSLTDGTYVGFLLTSFEIGVSQNVEVPPTISIFSVGLLSVIAFSRIFKKG